ncbi:MAG: hypothetical protein IT285_13795 [Bdellovibrionales bacterium]|nr:hypothetical protein [Bdellovibrionales bacterium]
MSNLRSPFCFLAAFAFLFWSGFNVGYRDAAEFRSMAGLMNGIHATSETPGYSAEPQQVELR